MNMGLQIENRYLTNDSIHTNFLCELQKREKRSRGKNGVFDLSQITLGMTGFDIFFLDDTIAAMRVHGDGELHTSADFTNRIKSCSIKHKINLEKEYVQYEKALQWMSHVFSSNEPYFYELQSSSYKQVKFSKMIMNRRYKNSTMREVYKDLLKIVKTDSLFNEIEKNPERKKWWLNGSGYVKYAYDGQNQVYCEYDEKDNCRYKHVKKKQVKICLQFVSNRIDLYNCDSKKNTTDCGANYELDQEGVLVKFKDNNNIFWTIKQFDENNLVFFDSKSQMMFNFARRKTPALKKEKNFFSGCYDVSGNLQKELQW